MTNQFEKLIQFFEKIKTISFLQRIFSWKYIRQLSYDAYEEFRSLIASTESGSQKIDKLERDNELLKNNNDHLSSINTKLEKEKDEIKNNLEKLNAEFSLIKDENTKFKQTEEQRRNDHEQKISKWDSIIEHNQKERQREIDEKHSNEIKRLEMLKETWSKHQDLVRSFIEFICQKHLIEYVDKVPFKGNPDNTIKICDEFVIFDAKSPATDDLSNFPNYIKNQTESVKKYIKENDVRKDIFLVVPSNAVEVIKQFAYNMADYNVYIVTVDVLEPLILSLKKIEEYEFVDQLTPEERENICRIIGKFAHVTKRRIQIDHFFAWEFLEILTKCKADLPKELLEKVIEFEEAEKLNPPQDKRAKQILTEDLKNDTNKIQIEAEAKAIIFPPALEENINKLPLSKDEE